MEWYFQGFDHRMIENLIHLSPKIEIRIYNANLSCNVPFEGPESPDNAVSPDESNIAVGINDTQVSCKFEEKNICFG